MARLGVLDPNIITSVPDSAHVRILLSEKQHPIIHRPRALADMYVPILGLRQHARTILKHSR